MTSAGSNARTQAPARAIDVPSEIAEILDVAETLATLLRRESELVRTLRITEIGPLQADKVRLTARYQSLLQGLGGPSHEKIALPPPLKAVLLEAGRRLTDAAIDNQQALRVGQAATDRLVGSIVTAIKQQRPNTTGYTTRKVAPRTTGLGIAGVTVDRRL